MHNNTVVMCVRIIITVLILTGPHATSQLINIDTHNIYSVPLSCCHSCTAVTHHVQCRVYCYSHISLWLLLPYLVYMLSFFVNMNKTTSCILAHGIL